MARQSVRPLLNPVHGFAGELKEIPPKGPVFGDVRLRGSDSVARATGVRPMRPGQMNHFGGRWLKAWQKG